MMTYNTVNFIYNDKLSKLEESYNVAKKRTIAINRKLIKLPDFREQR